MLGLLKKKSQLILLQAQIVLNVLILMRQCLLKRRWLLELTEKWCSLKAILSLRNFHWKTLKFTLKAKGFSKAKILTCHKNPALNSPQLTTKMSFSEMAKTVKLLNKRFLYNLISNSLAASQMRMKLVFKTPQRQVKLKTVKKRNKLKPQSRSKNFTRIFWIATPNFTRWFS